MQAAAAIAEAVLAQLNLIQAPSGNSEQPVLWVEPCVCDLPGRRGGHLLTLSTCAGFRRAWAAVHRITHQGCAAPAGLHPCLSAGS